MEIKSTIAEIRMALHAVRAGGTPVGPRSVGLVPTMGALHAGHLSLVAAAREACEVVVASIFVNPTQFGPNEDFSQYPRTFEADCAALSAAGLDFVFAPSVEEMYPSRASTFVVVEGVSDRLDGASRPGHFRGVTTIVSKLFHIVAPDRAYFGQKDAAQVAVLRQMVRDLDFDVELVVGPTVRDADGLALSSRNQYLSAEERAQALVLRRALLRAQELAGAGETLTAALLGSAQAVLDEEPDVRVDYLAAVDPDSLLPVARVSGSTLVAVAANVGRTRLIDNVLIGAA